MQKILIIQTAFIGDVVLATGVLEKMHQYNPVAQIDFLVRKGNEALFANHPFLNKVLVWHKKESKYKYLFQLLSTIRHTKYDIVINLQRFAATGFLTAFSKAHITIGFDKNPFSFLFSKKITHVFTGSAGKPLHEIERNHLLIESLTDAFAAKPRLYPSLADETFVKPYQQQTYICIAPASVWFTKQFPVEKWISFIHQIPHDCNVYLIGGPTDAVLCDSITAASLHPAIKSLAGKLSFLQSAALQKGAKMNYVNDSAPMHFASSVNASTTAVYCSTIPGFGYGPLSDNSFIVETPVPLPCRPCGIHGKKACPLGHFKCANNIMNEQLLLTIASN
ncbi:glycosyltransferase family 9 protein [Parasediminibacterium sp. JCM 36343]|uniref:glycosyltransferase family 9 protein n=1 Tax=Parasediminibacterium sp. JCM 36343 TaxID=3374279 RepID=UPI003977E6E9